MKKLVNGEYIDLTTEEEAAFLAPKPLADLKKERRDDLAEKRYRVETGGIVVGGEPIDTTDRSKVLINGSYNLSLQNVETPGFAVPFKTVNGWVNIPASDMIAIGSAVGWHVLNCFAREQELSALIAAATTNAEVEAIDIESGWPE